MRKKVKPFHQSIVKQLKAAEERISRNKSIGLFINRFITEVEIISTTIQTTTIAKEHLPELISSLEAFYLEFESKYPRIENACGAKRERQKIEKYFSEVIANLNQRLAA